MCRGKKTCSEFPEVWSRLCPLEPPPFFFDQIPIFADAATLAAGGSMLEAREALASVRSDDLREWFVEHGQQSGVFRNRHYKRGAQGPCGMALDPTRNPDENLKQQVWERDGFRCRYCGIQVVPIAVLKAMEKTVGREVFPITKVRKNKDRHGVMLAFCANADHVLPWKLGGATDKANLVTACWSCNYGKSDFTLDQLGLDDPRGRPPNSDDWDGLTSLF
jgi:5-methylcytosine-specific restriction endonuclease McrA